MLTSHVHGLLSETEPGRIVPLPQERGVGMHVISYKRVAASTESPDGTMLFPFASDMGFNHAGSDSYEPYQETSSQPPFCSLLSMLSSELTDGYCRNVAFPPVCMWTHWFSTVCPGPA